jgi:hypothetical protein
MGVGPGSLTYTSISKVVLWTDFPIHGEFWPGGPGIPFWGGNFRGYFAEGTNVAHMDGHAGYYKMTKLIPPASNGALREQTDPANAWSGAADAGRSYHWWGTNYASADNQ